MFGFIATLSSFQRVIPMSDSAWPFPCDIMQAVRKCVSTSWPARYCFTRDVHALHTAEGLLSVSHLPAQVHPRCITLLRCVPRLPPPRPPHGTAGAAALRAAPLPPPPPLQCVLLLSRPRHMAPLVPLHCVLLLSRPRHRCIACCSSPAPATAAVRAAPLPPPPPLQCVPPLLQWFYII